VTGPIVLAEFRNAIATHGIPASTLTDNGMVFTTRLSGGSLHGTRGRNSFEAELSRLGVVQKNSRPNHPSTCGKVERFQQTMKKWRAAQSEQPATLAQLQALIDRFADEYTTDDHTGHSRTGPPPRPPTKPDPRPPPATNRPTPTTGSAPTASTKPARSPSVTAAGSTPSASGEPTPNPRPRLGPRPRHPHHRHPTGELIRELTLDTTKRYEGTGRPPGPTR